MKYCLPLFSAAIKISTQAMDPYLRDMPFDGLPSLYLP
jgi:hypothetical protein